MSNSIQLPASLQPPAPPADALQKSPGTNTVHMRLSDGRVASLPESSLPALQQQDPNATRLPSPKQGEVLVQLSNKQTATLPATSINALRQADSGFKVIESNANSAPATTTMDTSALGTAYDTLQRGPSNPSGGTKTANAQNMASRIQAGQEAADKGEITAAGIGTGAFKGAAATAHSLGRAANLVTGDNVPGLPTSFEDPESTNASNTSEKVGKLGEGIVEFLMGDEALKGLAMSQKFGIAGKLATMAETSPKLAKALDIGMNAVRTGTVTGTQSLAHGGTAGDVAESAGLGALGSAALEGALAPFAKASEGEISEVTPGHFTKMEPGPTPQHGTPVEVASPLDNATINKMEGGKNLSPEAIKTLRQHVGGTPGAEIEVGSTPKNTVMKAVEPMQKTLTETGLKMNKVIQDAPAFKTSTIADTSSTLLKDIDSVRDVLPLKLDDPLNKVVDTQLQAAYPALESTDPTEILAYRRKLGQQIDWNKITNSPETTGEARDLTQVKIYNALGNKLHAEIPQTVELDKIFQPNLELQSHLDAKLGKSISRDPVEANAQQVSELEKGKKQFAIAAHNAKVDKNLKIAKWALGILGAGGLIDAAKHILP